MLRSLNGEGAYESGQTVDALPVGTHKVGFSEIADWTAPAAQDVPVVKDETASVSAAYVRHVGSVSVTRRAEGCEMEPERRRCIRERIHAGLRSDRLL